MQLLNVVETAKELRSSPATIRRMLAAGTINHKRIGKKIYFSPQDIILYLEKVSVPATKGANE